MVSVLAFRMQDGERMVVISVAEGLWPKGSWLRDFELPAPFLLQPSEAIGGGSAAIARLGGFAAGYSRTRTLVSFRRYSRNCKNSRRPIASARTARAVILGKGRKAAVIVKACELILNQPASRTGGIPPVR
jgi:hypothetical protein